MAENDEHIIATAKHTNIQSCYIIHAEVGRGSFGVVRKVRKKHTRREYACKTLKKNDKTPVHMLQREIESMRGLHHPHVLELQDVYEEAKFIHIISELCTGRELYERIGSGDWNATEQESAKLLQNILSAIAYLHENGVVHRDLKASNFLFVSPNTNTNVKIIDFGLARKVADDIAEHRLTTKVGTPYYVAPEVLLQDAYCCKCDVWSIGVIAYLVLSRGKLPFCGQDEKQTLALLKDPDLDCSYEPSEVWAEWSGSAKVFCQALLQKDPAARPTAREAMGLTWIQDMAASSKTHSFDLWHWHHRRSTQSRSQSVMENFFQFFDRSKPRRAASAPSGETLDADASEQYIPHARQENIQSVYNIQMEVGRGCFGIVRKVRKKHTRREYACKTIRKNDKTPIHMLQREIQAMEGLRHKHIIELQDVFEEPHFVHIVSDLIKGDELYERVGSGEWNATEQECAMLLQNILSAVAYMHEHGVVHRDLKASNFLFTSKQTNTDVKIIDFGLAAKVELQEGPADDATSGVMENILTTKVGTPYYVAPEVLVQDRYCCKCDVWSVGVIAYLVLSRGTLPYCGKDEQETCVLLRDPNLTCSFEPTATWSEWGNSAKFFCLALMQKDPVSRPSAREALELQWIQSLAGPPVSPKLKKGKVGRTRSKDEVLENLLRTKALNKP